MNARCELVSSSRSTVDAASACRGSEPVEQVGGRPEVPGPRPAAHRDVDAGASEDRGGERRRRRLAGGAGDADARPVPALEQQVAEARDARSPGRGAAAPAAPPRASRRRGRRSRHRRGRRRGRRPGSMRPELLQRERIGGSRAPGSRAARRCPLRRAAARARSASGPKPSIRTSTRVIIAVRRRRCVALRAMRQTVEKRLEPVDQLGLRRDELQPRLGQR